MEPTVKSTNPSSLTADTAGRSSLLLHRFALVTAAATLALIGVGGLVTSHGVGMSVPDWPNTYGYNMFFFPVSKWVGGIFYEHTHRLLASGVGTLTGILTLWLFGYKARPLMRWLGVALVVLALASVIGWPARWTDAVVLGGTGLILFGAGFIWPRCQPSSRGLRYLGLAAFFAVVLQGVLGGLRVVLYKDQIGIFHAALAQAFFVLLCILAFLTRKGAEAGKVSKENAEILFWRKAAWLFTGLTVLIFCQLVLGATMRHQHAGLSIPDFPLAYGKLWPATDSASIELYNARRMEIVSVNPITAFQIVLQMVHRLVALAILAGVGFAAWWSWRRAGKNSSVSRLAAGWLGLIIVQALLGAATIWSGKAADVATAHVITGAVSLAMGAIGTLLCFQTRNVTAPSYLSKQVLEIPSPSIPATAQPAAVHS